METWVRLSEEIAKLVSEAGLIGDVSIALQCARPDDAHRLAGHYMSAVQSSGLLTYGTPDRPPEIAVNGLVFRIEHRG